MTVCPGVRRGPYEVLSRQGAGRPRPVRGIEREEVIHSWAADGRAAYAARDEGERVAVVRIDMATGHREAWMEVGARNPIGSFGVREVLLTPDGLTYAYGHMQVLSDLYVVEGLR